MKALSASSVAPNILKINFDTDSSEISINFGQNLMLTLSFSEGAIIYSKYTH